MTYARWAFGLLGLAGCLTACFPSQDSSSYTPSYSVPSSYSSTSTTNTSSERSYRERTIVTDRGVTIIQRDRDGTRTIVRSDGYIRVDPPSPRRRR